MPVLLFRYIRFGMLQEVRINRIMIQEIMKKDLNLAIK
ncbi:hypothetical protein FLA_2321 [Filimonas lacunae]|nr:hypothetical protein FLA_2321 [Filimonas lacunae]